MSYTLILVIGFVLLVISLGFNFMVNKLSIKNNIYILPTIFSLVFTILCLLLERQRRYVDKFEYIIIDSSEVFLGLLTLIFGVVWFLCIIILIVKYVWSKLKK